MSERVAKLKKQATDIAAETVAAAVPTEAQPEPAPDYIPLSIYVITRKADFTYLPQMIDSLPKGIELNIVETIHDKDVTDEAPVLTHGETVKGRFIRTYQWRFQRWDFASARNAALKTCTRPWAMWMDSDDRMMPQSHDDIRGLIDKAGTGVGGYMMGCTGYQPPYQDGHRGSYYSAPHLRLHRNDERFRWRGYAHEQIDTSIQDAGYSIAESAVVILHVGYVTDVKALTAKMGRNVQLLCRQIAEDPQYIPAYYLEALKNNLTTYLEMKGASNG